MANTFTETYNLEKPEVGAAADTWGTTINEGLDSIDDLLDGTTPITGIDIDSGTIDGTAIGENSASTAKFVRISEAYSAITTSGGVLTIDTETASVFSVTLSEDVTSSVFNNPPASGTASGFTLKVIQDSTTRSIVWPTSVKWPSGVAPSLSTASGAIDIFAFFTHDGGTSWYGFTAGQAMA